jgi:hypothetical protein
MLLEREFAVIKFEPFKPGQNPRTSFSEAQRLGHEIYVYLERWKHDPLTAKMKSYEFATRHRHCHLSQKTLRKQRKLSLGTNALHL